MSDAEQRVIRLLEEIRDNQRRQIAQQSEALRLQIDQFALAREQFEKAKTLQERAEHLQEKSEQLIEKGRRIMAVILPVFILLILYLTWLIFR